MIVGNKEGPDENFMYSLAIKAPKAIICASLLGHSATNHVICYLNVLNKKN